MYNYPNQHHHSSQGRRRSRFTETFPIDASHNDFDNHTAYNDTSSVTDDPPSNLRDIEEAVLRIHRTPTSLPCHRNFQELNFVCVTPYCRDGERRTCEYWLQRFCREKAQQEGYFGDNKREIFYKAMLSGWKEDDRSREDPNMNDGDLITWFVDLQKWRQGRSDLSGEQIFFNYFNSWQE